MLSLPDVTIISVAGSRADSALDAIHYSQRGITFGASKILAPQPPKFLGKSVSWTRIPALGGQSASRKQFLRGYSYFMIYELWKYVDTEYALVVQADGFVTNPRKWSSEFLEFDYIGAPWPPKESAYSGQRVGNGGFSLRSKKLLSIPNHFNVPWGLAGDEQTRRKFKNTHEDMNICVYNRHIFEEGGCKFAPVRVAARFSQERFVAEARWVQPFGFHGTRPAAWRRLLPVTEPRVIVDNLYKRLPQWALLRKQK